MIEVYLNGILLPPVETPFLRAPIEIAQDVEVLSGDLYTDFIGLKYGWSLKWDSLDEDTYDAIYEIYLSQIETGEYPTVEVPYYGIESLVRMKINEKDIWNNCGSVQNVNITLRETNHTVTGGSS